MAYYNPGWVWLYRKVKSEQSFASVAARFVLEGYIEFLVSGILSFELFSKIDLIMTNGSDALTFLVGLFFFIIVVYMPYLITKSLKQKIKFMEDTQNQFDKAEELYELKK